MGSGSNQVCSTCACRCVSTRRSVGFYTPWRRSCPFLPSASSLTGQDSNLYVQPAQMVELTLQQRALDLSAIAKATG